MPTYEYKCEGGCPNFEKDQRITEPALGKCPNCGNPVKRVIGNVVTVVNCPGFFGKSK